MADAREIFKNFFFFRDWSELVSEEDRKKTQRCAFDLPSCKIFLQDFPSKYAKQPYLQPKAFCPSSLTQAESGRCVSTVCVCVSDGADAMGGNAQSALVHSVKLYWTE